MNDACDICPHAWDEHNGMGDCTHLDGRTATGFCAYHQGE
jgi:hypothetical protein